VVRDFIAGDEPVGDEGVVCIVERGKVGHFGSAPVGVLSLGEELVHGVERVRLNGICSRVGSEQGIGGKKGGDGPSAVKTINWGTSDWESV
jgi:hypothetical protein